jgi:ABC-2 type transport system permease protein
MRKFLHDTMLVFGRAMRLGRRQPQMAFVFPVLFPLFIIVLMSRLYGDFTKVPGFPTSSYAEWIAPGVFLMAAMFGAGASANALIEDIRSGYLERLRLLPVHPGALLAGRLLFDATRVVAAGLLVLAASVALGAELDGGLAAVAPMALVLALWSLAYGGMFYVVGLKTRSAEKLATLIPLFMPIAFLSSVFVPRSQLDGWVAVAARINPYTYVVDAVRSLMSGTPSWGSFGTGVVAALVAIAITQVGAAKAFRRLVTAD